MSAQLTKQQVLLIADAIAEARDYILDHTSYQDEAPEEATAIWAVETTAKFVARKLEEVNPRFKRDAFLDAAVINWST